MFKKKQDNMSKNNIQETKPNTIVLGTSIKGEIKAESDFRIDGLLIGSISSKGKIVVGKSGTIEGEIICQNADISGTIKAQVAVEQLLTLKSSAQVYGDIITGKLAIEPGARFTGSCNMDGSGLNTENSAIKNGQERSKEKTIK